ncbi:hypothetical protein LINGRAHAP2_LOCUS15602, partial [Linum grandiflorum]
EKKKHKRSKHSSSSKRHSYSEDDGGNGERKRSSHKHKSSKHQDSYRRRRNPPPKQTEEERAAKLREMQLDAEIHEEQRWKQLKKADEEDVREDAQAKQIRGKNFLDAAANLGVVVNCLSLDKGNVGIGGREGRNRTRQWRKKRGREK